MKYGSALHVCLNKEQNKLSIYSKRQNVEEKYENRHSICNYVCFQFTVLKELFATAYLEFLITFLKLKE